MVRTFATGLAVACYAGLVAAQTTADKDGVGIKVKNGDAFGVVEAQSVVGSKDGKGIPGYTTYRLSLQLSGDAANVYTIFGRENEKMSFPPAYQVAAPFGANVSLALAVRRAATRVSTCPCMRPVCICCPVSECLMSLLHHEVGD